MTLVSGIMAKREPKRPRAGSGTLVVKVELRLVDNGLLATLEHRPQSRVLLLQLKVPHLSRGTAISVSRSRALDTQSGVLWPLVDCSPLATVARQLGFAVRAPSFVGTIPVCRRAVAPSYTVI